MALLDRSVAAWDDLVSETPVTERSGASSVPPSVRALLADGSVVRLRELTLADTAAVGRLHRELPEMDRYLRFFSTVPVQADEVLARHVLSETGAAVGAFRGAELIGIANYVVDSDPAAPEIALAVAHPQQVHGVGTLLLEHLASVARRRGVRRFVAEVLPENYRMNQVFRTVGLPVRITTEGGQQHVELDLQPDERYLSALAEREAEADVASLTAVLAPQSVAVVGASRRHDTVGNAVLRSIVDAGFVGELVAVNPHANDVNGVPCYRSVRDLPGPVDLAVICVPAAAVPRVAEDCGQAGVRALLVISSGISADHELSRALLDVIRRYDMRMVGPNCIGLANMDPRVRLNAGFAGRVETGHVGLATQSGGVAVAIQQELGRLGMGVSTSVSTGDKYDVSGNDMLLWWRAEQRTSIAVLYLESFGNPRKFSRFARRLAERIPVLTIRSGSSDAGQRAAASHTAATATPQVNRDALFRQAGVLAVDRIGELTELIAALSWQPLPAGPRIGVISNAGGAGVLAADACVARGLSVQRLPETSRLRLSEVLPPGAATSNPIDTTALVPPKTFASGVATLLDSPAIDAVIALTVHTGLGDPFAGIADLSAQADKPLYVVRLGQAEHVTAAAAESGSRVPCFADPAAAATALAHAVQRAHWLARPSEPAHPPRGIDPHRASAVVTEFLSGSPDGGWLDPVQVQDVLGAFGVPILPVVIAADPERAVAALAAAGGPVAVKAMADGLLHKSASGGVRLNLDTPEAVDRAARELQARFGPRLRGLVVQPMVDHAVELLLGVTSDPDFGPLVTLGLGGTATDLIADRVHALVPMSTADADSLLDELRASRRLLQGQPGGDQLRARLRDVVLRLARLAEMLPEVVELDINPLTVRAERWLALDARIRVAPPPQGDPALRRLKV